MFFEHRKRDPVLYLAASLLNSEETKLSILAYQGDIDTKTLKPNDIHVWYFSMPSQSFMNRFSSMLTDSEKRRIDKFRFARDAARFTGCRGLLRELLGSYINCSPKDVAIQYGPFGKPHLDESIYFNVSHSGDMLAYAFSAEQEIGIDIESVIKIDNISGTAKHCLSKQQFRVFTKLSCNEQHRAFYRFWTRKEALLKAIGTGLSQPLTNFDVTFLDDELPALTKGGAEFGNIKDWKLFEPVVSHRHHSTIATSCTQGHLKLIRSTNGT